MLDFEEAPQERLNDAGAVATTEGLKQFDADGSPITVGPVKFTSTGQVEKVYQTPYGVATVARHVYQSPADLEADSTKRRRLLVEALRAAEGADEARRVRTALANLEGPGKEPGGQPRGTEEESYSL